MLSIPFQLKTAKKILGTNLNVMIVPIKADIVMDKVHGK